MVLFKFCARWRYRPQFGMSNYSRSRWKLTENIVIRVRFNLVEHNKPSHTTRPRIASFHTHALTFFVCFFILFHSCLGRSTSIFGKHASMSSPFPIAILNALFFTRQNRPSFGQSFAYQNLIILPLITHHPYL